MKADEGLYYAPNFAHPDGKMEFAPSEVVIITEGRKQGIVRCEALIKQQSGSHRGKYRPCHAYAAGARAGMGMCLPHMKAISVPVRMINDT